MVNPKESHLLMYSIYIYIPVSGTCKKSSYSDQAIFSDQWTTVILRIEHSIEPTWSLGKVYIL